jgi:hypothetical protein
MGADSLNADVAKELDELDQLLGNAEFDAARAKVAAIRKAYGELTRTAGAEAYMARMEILADEEIKIP